MSQRPLLQTDRANQLLDREAPGRGKFWIKADKANVMWDNPHRIEQKNQLFGIGAVSVQSRKHLCRISIGLRPAENAANRTVAACVINSYRTGFYQFSKPHM